MNRNAKVPKQRRAITRHDNVPDDAVLLIPEPEHQNDTPPYGVKTGYYNSIEEEAAALMESLGNNHGFLDGNKRIAFTAADVFL